MLKIIASEVAKLDSNVYTGGGTDDTDALQKVLDMAPEHGGVHLVMDGAALVRGLKLHSNTTIECVNSDCGFYMADNANRPILSNYNWNILEITTYNIALIGGTYNHNCAHQVHHLSMEEFPFPPRPESDGVYDEHLIYLMEFYGVENFSARDIHYRNQRCYTLTLGNFRNALVENCCVDVGDQIMGHQDGFHFFGPGKFLTMRNLRGATGDDFINISADEMDGISPITDVLIDGVTFDDTYQGIRMLSRGTGRIDRVTLRNIRGNYRTFAFSIIPCYHGDTFGNFGDIFIENVDVRQIESTYNYSQLTFMQLGGNVDCFTLTNVRFRHPVRSSVFNELGRPYFYRPEELTREEAEKYNIYDFDFYTKNRDWMPEGKRPFIKNFVLDNVIFESDSKADRMDIIEAKYNIGNLTLSNVKYLRFGDASAHASMVKLAKEANISRLFVENVYAEKLESIVSGTGEHNIDVLVANNVTLKDGKKAFDTEDVRVGTVLANAINEI